jgi:tetratricopeptide (TPR) repeat protein
MMLAAVAAVAVASATAEQQFADVKAAIAAFSSATNDTVRRSAYAYARDYALEHVGETAARDVLVHVRTMARSLDKESDFRSTCERLSESTNSLVRLSALMWLCDYARELDAEKTTAFIDARLAKTAAADVPVRSFLLCRRMDARRKLGDEAGVMAAADAIVAFGDDCPWSNYSQARFAQAEALMRKGKADEAETCLSTLLERDEVVSQGTARKLLSLRTGKALQERFVAAMREKIAAVPFGNAVLFRSRVQSGMPEIVELLVGIGRLDEALGECRVMLLTASSSQSAYGNAVRQTADVLKRLDGNLGRAFAFLESQKTNGVSSAAGLLPMGPALSDPVRVAEREKCLAFAKENQSSWGALVECSFRLLWADSAEDSMRVAMSAFACAPFSEKELQTCADAVMHPVSVMTRDKSAVAAVRSYLLYGEAGRDGVRGSDDDVANPVDVYRSHAGKGAVAE